MRVLRGDSGTSADLVEAVHESERLPVKIGRALSGEHGVDGAILGSSAVHKARHSKAPKD